MSKIIGLTGQTGSGKGAVSSILSEMDAQVIDCDLIAHRVTEKGSETLEKLVSAFTSDILKDDGSLDRSALASRAFADPQSVRLLNSITHPAIIEHIRRDIAALKSDGADCIVLDAPTLIESGAADMCDVIIAVVADEDIRLNRIMQRDGIDISAARRRMLAQPKPEFYTDNSDYTIYNNGDLISLKNQVMSVFNDIIKENCE